MSIVRIVCLANSWKLNERCVAGIELSSGAWVRPVSNLPHGEVPTALTVVSGHDIGLLDVVDVPLSAKGPDYGFERENRLIEPGPWQLVAKLQPKDVEKYCENAIPFLHNNYKYVGKGSIAGLPPKERRTLQLVRVETLPIQQSKRASGKMKWEASVRMQNGQDKWLGITDPIFCQGLEHGHIPKGRHLLTLSLSLPYTPPNWDGVQDPCWKLVAGVIAL